MGAQLMMQQPQSVTAVAAVLQEQLLLRDTLKGIIPFVGMGADMVSQKQLERELGIKVSLKDYSKEDLEMAIHLVECEIEDIRDFHQLILSRAAQEKTAFLLQVSSYAVFHVDEEERFRESFMVADGHAMQILDGATGEYRMLKYQVSDAAIYYPGVEII